MRNLFFNLTLLISSVSAFGQVNNAKVRLEERIIIADSSKTVLIPVSYSSLNFPIRENTLSTLYYANIIVYNYIDDTRKRLFENDCFIDPLEAGDAKIRVIDPFNNKHRGTSWQFFLVKTREYHKRGDVRLFDPSVLYVCDGLGNGLKAITPANVNVIDVTYFPDEEVAIIHIQRDQNNDGDFNTLDESYYYLRLNLVSMELSEPIEVISK
jgi:hypothetical protein